MCSRTAAWGRISKGDVSKAHVGSSVGDTSQDDPLKAHQVGRFLRQLGKNYAPCARFWHENRQHENCRRLGEELLLTSMGLV